VCINPKNKKVSDELPDRGVYQKLNIESNAVFDTFRFREATAKLGRGLF
jgi:hypothetical protein